MDFPKRLSNKLQERQVQNSLRTLIVAAAATDFSSNDYLGFSKSTEIFHRAHNMLVESGNVQNGATGSRLLTGNQQLHETCEQKIATFHNTEAALLFNSGYDANIGIFSSIPQRNDLILFDELCHASIRDGIKMSLAKSYKFAHNDLEDLERLLHQFANDENSIYIATESVFSMDGDSPDLTGLSEIASKYNAYIIIDEAHALGVFGESGEGMVQSLELQDQVFIRLMTFGKALGCHGAVVLCSAQTREYLINFARSFIYTTALPPHAVATILCAYSELESTKSIAALRSNINFFNREKTQLGLKQLFVRSKSAIQSAIVPGNDNVKALATALQQKGYDIRPILSPTVPDGQERLRICIHSFNTEAQISDILRILASAF